MTDDRDDRSVIGDALSQRGDPQGELVGLQLALEAMPKDAPRVRRAAIERRVAVVLDTHHDALYGSLAPFVTRLSLPDLRRPAFTVTAWRGGFAEAVALFGHPATLELPAIVRAMRELSIARFATRVAITAHAHAEAVRELVAFAPMRELVVQRPYGADLLRGGALFEPKVPSDLVLDDPALAPLLARLELLGLAIPHAVVPIHSTSLRTLHLWQTATETPFEATLPNLEDLRLSNFVYERGMFDRFPRIRNAQLYGTFEPGWFEHLCLSPHAARLERLALGWSLPDEILDLAVRHRDRFTRCERLDLSGSTFSREAIARNALNFPRYLRI